MFTRNLAAVLALGAAILAPAQANAATATASVNANIVKPLTLTGGGTIGLGNIYTPSTATYSGTFTIQPTASQTGFTCTGTTSSAMFNITGTNNTPLTVNIPNTVTLTNTATPSATITLTTSNSLAANVAGGNYVMSLPNSGAPGVNFYVGGAMTVSQTTVEGAYSATFTVTANYN